MAIRTPTEWLELIDDALAGIISGKLSSYSIGGRSFTRHDIRALEDLRAYWESRQAESRNGFVSYGDFGGGAS